MLDYWLPDWNGVGLCRSIRAADPHVPIVFYSTSSRGDEKARALRAGASAYRVKPLDPAVLRSCLSGLMARAEAESQRAQVEERRAVQEELERRLRLAQDRARRKSAMLAEVLHMYDVTCAGTAYEARCEIDRGAFDLYVLDHWLPDVGASSCAAKSARPILACRS